MRAVMKKLILASLIATALTACASAPKNFTLEAFSGSRADGVVQMGYIGGYGWVKNVNWIASGNKAAKACQSWGYEGAEKFGLGSSVCIKDNGASGAFKMCTEAKFTVEYQCTGKRVID